MSLVSTSVRATHLVTNAAWFGGSLFGAVGLNPASREPDTERERVEVSGTGWERWGPVQGAAIALHLVSGLAISADNRNRVLGHPPTTAITVAKAVITGAAVASTAAAYVDPRAAEDARRTLKWLQWVTPALTGAMLVLDAELGEQQRGVAGLLDRRW
jgi:putative copper export protein